MKSRNALREKEGWITGSCLESVSVTMMTRSLGPEVNYIDIARKTVGLHYNQMRSQKLWYVLWAQVTYNRSSPALLVIATADTTCRSGNVSGTASSGTINTHHKLINPISVVQILLQNPMLCFK
ncbi:hypothetical protein J6590_019729 [Homalodisca vitripennis]|nr:hypothetical protein J6590_019729 [Homalodisca vitripennis]